MAAQDIIDAIDALIQADMEGNTLEDLADNKLGPLSTLRSKTIPELVKLREYYVQVAIGEGGGPGFVETEVGPI